MAMTGKTMQELIDRLAQTTGSNRELDLLLFEFAAPERFEKLFRARKGICPRYATADQIRLTMVEAAPAYTGSIDAALTLVPVGWSVDLGINPDDTGNHARIYNDGLSNEPSEIFHGNKSPATSICIAALKVRAAR